MTKYKFSKKPTLYDLKQKQQNNKHEVSMGNLYDLNKQLVLQLPALTQEDYNKI